MKLSMYLGRDLDYSEFVRTTLIRNFYKYVRLNLSETNSKNIEKYIKETLNESISVKYVIDYAFKNMNIENSKGTYKIYTNESLMIPRTNLRLETVLKLIEYGNMDIKGCNIFTNARQYILENKEALYDTYRRVGAI